MVSSRRKGMFAPGGLTPPIVRPGSVQKPSRGMFGERPQAQAQRPKANWADGAGMLGAMLRDLDGTMGSNNTAYAKADWDAHVARQLEKQEADRMERIRQMAAMGDQSALGYLDPIGNRAFNYNQQRDAVGDQRYDTTYQDGRADRADDVGHRDKVFGAGRADRAEDVDYRDKTFDRGVMESDRGYGLQKGAQDYSQMHGDRTFGLAEDQLALAERKADAGAGRTPEYVKQVDKASKLAEIQASVDMYRKLIQEKGTQGSLGRFTQGTNRREIDSARTALQLQLKDAAELGVLAGPDLDLLNDLVGADPTRGILAWGPNEEKITKPLDNVDTFLNEQRLGIDAGAQAEVEQRRGTNAQMQIARELEGMEVDGAPVTEDDIEQTMRENGMTREQVINALRGGN